VPPLQNIANRLERVADQARNICQDVLYLCTGEYAKHIGSEVFRVLFVDQDNSSASQMAEALGNAQKQTAFVFSSAGLEAGPLDPSTVAFMKAKGYDLGRQYPKAVDQVPNLGHYQVFVALTKEAQRVFPAPPTKAVCLDWSPSGAARSVGAPEDGLERTHAFLKAHITDLVEAVIHDQNRGERCRKTSS
jgi:phosphate transport system protein